MGCIIDKKNLGTGRCQDLPSLIRGIITTPADFKATEADIADQTFWQDAIADSADVRIYLWPLFATVPEDRSSETIYEENPVSYDLVLDGRYRWMAQIAKSLCFHKAAFTHRGKGDRVWIIDGKKNVIGTYVGVNDSDEALYSGFTLDLLNPENLKFNDGSVSTKSPLLIALADPNEVNDAVYGAFMFACAFLHLLQPLTDVTIVSGDTQTTSNITVDVAVKCDDTAVSGLVAGDFSVTTTAGASQTITTVTESSTVPGRYVINRASGSYVDGFGPQDLSLYPDSAYEAITMTLDIP